MNNADELLPKSGGRGFKGLASVRTLLAAASLAVTPASQAQTVYQVAQPTTRAWYMPRAGDVQIRTVNPTVGGAYDTLQAARNFYATRLDWIYPGGNSSWVQQVLAAGYPLEPTVNWDLHDSSTHPERSRSLDVYGEAISATWVVGAQAIADRWACGNTYEYRQIWLSQAKAYVDWGLYTLQQDDQSGNGRPMSSGWQPSAATNTINTGPACFCGDCVARFHSYLLTQGQTSWAQNYPTNHFAGTFLANRAFMVFLVSQSADSQFGLGGNAENGAGGTPRLYLQRGGVSYDTLGTLTGASVAGQTEITTFTHDGDSTLRMYRNGILQSASGIATVVTNFGSGGHLTIPFQNGNLNHAGDVGEVIIYNRLLTDDQRQGIEAYLGAKYGGVSGTPLSPGDTNLALNLKLWLKADTLLGSCVDGAAVTNWSAAAGFDATVPKVTLPNGQVAAAPTFKTNVLNGWPAVRFDGTNDLLGFYWFNVRDYVLNYVTSQNMQQATSALKTQFLNFEQYSQRDFFTNVHNALNAYAGRYIPMSCNGNPATDPTPSYLFDYGIAELGEGSATPVNYYSGAKAALALAKVQTWTTPEPANSPAGTITNWDVQWPSIKPLTRRSIACAYAAGGNMFAPWDVFQPQGNARYFGVPADYNYLFKMVRDYAGYFDGYDDAYATGYTLPTDARYSAPYPITITGGSGKVAGFVRVKAGNPNAPAVIHLVECDTNPPQPFTLTIQNSRFFTNQNRVVRMIFHDAQTNTTYSVTNYSTYSTVTVPSLATWALVMLSVSNSAPLVWVGTNSGAWDINGAINWRAGSLPLAYQEAGPPGDAVQFDDSAAGATVLTLDGAVQPAGVTVSNSALNYSLSGKGGIAGATGLAKSGGGTFSLNTTNLYLGPTQVGGGALIVNGSISSGAVTVGTNAILGGGGSVGGSVTVNGGVLAPGTNILGGGNTLTLGGDLTLGTGSGLALDFANVTNAGSGINDLVAMHGGVLRLAGPVTVTANLLNGYLASGPYTLISNAVAIIGDVPSLLSAPGLSVTFSTNTGPGPYNVYMASTYVGQDLVWRGTNANHAWDINTTANWSNTVTHAAASPFHATDAVTFNDTAASGAVTLAATVYPAAMTVSNNSLAYAFGGPGSISGAGGLTKLGTGTLTITNLAANSYTGPTQIKRGILIVGGTNGLPPGTALMLGDTSGTAGSLNLGSVSQVVGALTNLSLTPATNLVTIGNGQSLTVNGPVVSGYNPTNASASSNVVVMTGGGSLVVTNTALFRVGANDVGTSSFSYDRTILDLSGLAAANLSLGAGGTMYVGDLSSAGAATGPANSTLVLASNTTITAGFLKMGNSSREKIAHNLILGSGSNVFLINTNLLGIIRDGGQIYFNTASGSLRMRAADGSGRAYLGIGASAGTSYGVSNQLVDLGGHYADLLLASLKVGEENRGSTDVAYSSNYFGFGNGLLDTTELRVGNRPGNPPSTPALWYNVCNLGGGTVSVGAGGITMGTSRGSNGSASTNSAVLNISGGLVTVSNNVVLLTQLSTAGNNAAVSALNITGGTNIVYGDILCGIGAGSPAAHTATLTLNGAAALLDLTGHTLGGASQNPVNYLDVLDFQAGTLQNVAQLNGGADLVKTSPNLLTLAGANTYSGRTVVSNGTLLVNGVIGTNAVLAVGGRLGGAGVIRGPVTVQAGGSLAPGVGGIAALTISNSLTLLGTTVMEIARNGAVRTNDAVTGLSTVNYGGVILVTNIGASPLLPGDSFKLFSAGAYAGAVTNLVLPGGGYTWTNRLLSDGTIAVLSSPYVSSPTFLSPKIVGGQLVLQGTNGTPNGAYYLMSSTNLSLPRTNWTAIATNTFDNGGSFSNCVPVNAFGPQSFFLLKQ